MQTPAPFGYARATSVGHAVALLTEFGPDARVVAGGHSLLPRMKLRMTRPSALVDINDLTELSHVRCVADELRIGALARHADLLDSAEAGEHHPILHEAERLIADPAVRNLGTVGGSLCYADPSQDLAAVFAALRAEAVIHGPSGTRTVPVRRFHTGPYSTVVGRRELLVELRVPLRARTGSAYAKVQRRACDWPVAAAGAVVRLSPDGESVADAGIGLAGLGAEQYAAPRAEDFLRGAPATPRTLARAGALAAAEDSSPAADQRGPADYKRHLAAELTARALGRAVTRARARMADRPRGEG